jgi:hypothetical protein
MGLENVLTFGKYKGQGKKVADLVKSDPGYLLWLRDEKKKATGQTNFFTPAVLAKLNEAISNSKSLRKQFSEWPLTAPVEPETKDEILAALKAGKVAEKAQEEAVVNYQQWGAF